MITPFSVTPLQPVLISGDSPTLRQLTTAALAATPWLSYGGDRLVFDWSAAVAAWAVDHAAEGVEARLVDALSELLPELPLLLFAVDAPSVNYFHTDERLAGLTLATHRMPVKLLRVLEGWEVEVDRFRAAMSREFELGAAQEIDPYRDGTIQRVLTKSAALAAAIEFRQTLNLHFNLTNRLCVASADMTLFLNGAVRAYSYEKPTFAHRTEVWRELQQLCQLRLDLLALLNDEVAAQQERVDATIASLARRERQLFLLLNAKPKASKGRPASNLWLGQRPGYAIGVSDGSSLSFDLSPYTSSGSMIRRFGDDWNEIPLPRPQEMLLTALRHVIPNPYHLTARHASYVGVEAARSFAGATERLQNYLRKLELEEFDEPASVDRATLEAAARVDQVLQWALSKAPLVTLLLSGFLATYRDKQAWGFGLSPWVIANSLSRRVLKGTPLSYFLAAGALDEEEAAEAEPSSDADAKEQLSGLGVWASFMKT